MVKNCFHTKMGLVPRQMMHGQILHGQMLHGQMLLGHLSTVKDGSTNLKWPLRGGGAGWLVMVEINAISVQLNWYWD